MTTPEKAIDEIDDALRVAILRTESGKPAPDALAEVSFMLDELRAGLLPTLRAALAPVTDEEVERIRERHEELERLGELAHHDWASEAHADRATLLAHVSRLSAELAAERERRVEADMFWDYYDPEQPYYSVEELVQEREYEGEGIVQVQEAIRCPDAAYIYRIKNDPETDDREIVLERLSDADHVHYRASMAVARGAREMWGVMVDRLAAQLFEENPATVPERMHTCQWKNLDWHYRKHHRSLAHDRLAATLTKD